MTSEFRILLQWFLLAAMISLLFMCWTLLLMTWKRRRQEIAVATYTATLISAAKAKRGEEEVDQETARPEMIEIIV